LPSSALLRLARYNQLKSNLKNRLRDLIHRQEKADSADRAAAFARLAEEQWPQLSNLEVIAEEIRADLSPRFVPVPPAKPPAIPDWLLEIINAYDEDRDSYYGERREAVRRTVEEIPRPARSFDSDEQLRLEQEYLARRNETQRLAIAEFQTKNIARIEQLERRSTAIRTALEAIARTIVDPKTGRPLSVERLLQQHVATMDAFEGFGRATAIYSHYRTAVLQPGLSPEQRRLLFAYAVASLAQPLPHGELFPTRAAKFPLPR
jgi:hypothetical protein